MKRSALLLHLHANGCAILREGRKHTIVINIAIKKASSVPRHKEIDDFLAKKICRDLGIAKP
jgi:hypothetical protein